MRASDRILTRPRQLLSMDEQAIADRAQVTEEPAALHPNRSVGDGPRFVAEDPETGCSGVGEFELEARTNLVFAVEAYRADLESDVGYVSAGRGQTCKRRWESNGGVGAWLRDALPF